MESGGQEQGGAHARAQKVWRNLCGGTGAMLVLLKSFCIPVKFCIQRLTNLSLAATDGTLRAQIFNKVHDLQTPPSP